MIGLVLQGGGAKGGYHIGVWKALRELGIEIGAVTGTSVGALNGAMIAQGDFEQAYQIWDNMDPRMVIKDDPEIYHQLVTRNYDIKNRQMYYDYFGRLIQQRGLNIEPLVALIDQIIDEDRIRSSDIDFGLVTVSLTDWKAIEIFVEDMAPGEIKDYMLASAFLPAFKSQMIRGKKYLDGGFHDSMPINLISTKGYSEIVAVELGSMGVVRSVKNKKLNIRYITPSGDTGSILEFDRDLSRNNIKMGYLDAMRSYGRYEGSSFYLTHVPEEAYFRHAVLSYDDETIMAMADIIGCKDGYPRRVLHELIIPELCDMLGMDIHHNYHDLMVGALEFLAAGMEIPRLQVYSYEELFTLVREKSSTASKRTFNFDLIPDILRRSSIVRHNFKADLLIKWMGITSGIYEQ